MPRKQTPHCWCGCGAVVGTDAFFVVGHDVAAALALATTEYGSIQKMIEAHNYGPRLRDYSLRESYNAAITRRRSERKKKSA